MTRWRVRIFCRGSTIWTTSAHQYRRLINCELADIAFINNAATALSLLIGGIEWKAGDQVLSLEHEFPNNLYWPSLLASQGVEFLEVPYSELLGNLTGERGSY